MKSKLLILFCAVLILSPHAFAADDRTDYYRGLELYHSKNFEAAVSAFRSQIKKTPDDISVKKWLDLSEKRLAQEAPIELTAPNVSDSYLGSTTNPSILQPSLAPSQTAFSGDLYEKGISLYLGGNYADSLTAFNAYLKANPNHVATQQWIALVKDLLPGGGTQTPRSAIAESTKSTPPTAFSQTSKPTPAPAPATAPVPAPVLAKPATPKSDPTPTVSAREKQLEAANAELKLELKKSEEMTRRAIEQTKKALALPQPSFQSYESDSIQKNLTNQVTELRDREEDLLAEIEKLRSRKPDDGGTTARATANLEKEVLSLRNELNRAQSALRAAEETKATTQQRWTQSEAARRQMNGAIEATRKSNEVMGNQLKQTQTQLADARRELSQSGEWRTNLQNTERALEQATAQAKTAEAARSASERRQAETAQELQRLQNLQAGLRSALDAKTTELAKARKQLVSFDLLLEESRAQGLQLVMDAQKERQKREATEQHYRAEENRLNTEILSLKEKLKTVLPQLEAVRSSLDGLDSASR